MVALLTSTCKFFLRKNVASSAGVTVVIRFRVLVQNVYVFTRGAVTIGKQLAAKSTLFSDLLSFPACAADDLLYVFVLDCVIDLFFVVTDFTAVCLPADGAY